MAVSAAKRLACEDSNVLRLPWSSSTALFQVARRARWTLVAMSAIMNWIALCMAIGTPNWTRCLEYSIANSIAARATPVAIAATPGRVRSSVIIASLKPLFSSPTRWFSGISTSGNVIVAVFDARWPILSSWWSTITPASRGTMKQEMPRWPASLSVFAYTVYQFAYSPFVMKHLDPLMTHLSPLRTALVFIPETSDPASGSVRQNEASSGASARRPMYSFLMSSDAASSTGAVARPLQVTEVLIPEQPQASSSSMMQPSR